MDYTINWSNPVERSSRPLPSQVSSPLASVDSDSQGLSKHASAPPTKQNAHICCYVTHDTDFGYITVAIANLEPNSTLPLFCRTDQFQVSFL
jgi:hypothetical protein